MTDYPAGAALSRARRKAIKEALATLDGSVRLTPSRRHYAVHRIQQARSPKSEVKRLIRGYLQGALVVSNQPDLSDAREARVRLIRRDHWLDPQVCRLLGSLDRAVACGLAHPEFQRRATVLVQLKPTMPAAWRKAEAMMARNGETPASGGGQCNHRPLAECEGGEPVRLADAGWNVQAVEGDGVLQVHAPDAPAPANPAPRRLWDGGAR